MAVKHWSEEILLVELDPEPEFSAQLAAAREQIEQRPVHAVVSLGKVDMLNSSNIGQLLRLRQKLVERDRKLRLCAISDQLWGVLLAMGLDKVFQFAEDVPSALAGLQLEGQDRFGVGRNPPPPTARS